MRNLAIGMVGDCFNDSGPSFGDQGAEVTDVLGVPCSEPHDNEVCWNQHNDREVICAVFDVNAAKLVGSAKGLAL